MKMKTNQAGLQSPLLALKILYLATLKGLRGRKQV